MASRPRKKNEEEQLCIHTYFTGVAFAAFPPLLILFLQLLQRLHLSFWYASSYYLISSPPTRLHLLEHKEFLNQLAP